MTDERFRNRCIDCGDQSVDLDVDGSYRCTRHFLPASPVDLFKRLAEGHTDAVSNPEAERLERELAKFKAKLWRDRVMAITRSWVAKNAFDPAAKRTPALIGVQRWLADGGRHALVIRGPVGVGKTSAACFAVRQWCEPKVHLNGGGEPVEEPTSAKPRVTWLRPDQLVSAIMHDYDERSPRLHAHVVIDDLGRETRAEFIECLCELLDRDGHTLLITSNLTKPQMAKRYEKEPRLIDRLKGQARALDLEGASLRPQGGDF